MMKQMLKVTPIPIFKDNYAYLLQCTKTNLSALVDPAEPIPAMAAVKDTKLEAILTTHHHNDHAGGNAKVVQTYPGIKVYAADERVKEMTIKANSPFKLGALNITPLLTPGHTNGSVSYYVEDEEGKDKVVFTGDTLFIGGEYTEANLKFALTVDPHNQKLKEKYNWAQKTKITVPSTLQDEWDTNPFMRVAEESVQKAVGVSNPIDLMGTLRELKNNFRG
ncbi:hypothetical protein HK103_001636 [Boothiomyces macroporosus]|uniref:hydroxyacylglutathione hydrolase n=1 Tax=Boothiomyces macroporosus TaxID=261099 RepID=A0AAD5UA53_9FUNG|nr:hypothetical protein HK103_001636 [Boothiomyces macroporosus]